MAAQFPHFFSWRRSAVPVPAPRLAVCWLCVLCTLAVLPAVSSQSVRRVRIFSLVTSDLSCQRSEVFSLLALEVEGKGVRSFHAAAVHKVTFQYLLKYCQWRETCRLRARDWRKLHLTFRSISVLYQCIPVDSLLGFDRSAPETVTAPVVGVRLNRKRNPQNGLQFACALATSCRRSDVIVHVINMRKQRGSGSEEGACRAELTLVEQAGSRMTSHVEKGNGTTAVLGCESRVRRLRLKATTTRVLLMVSLKSWSRDQNIVTVTASSETGDNLTLTCFGQRNVGIFQQNCSHGMEGETADNATVERGTPPHSSAMTDGVLAVRLVAVVVLLLVVITVVAVLCCVWKKWKLKNSTLSNENSSSSPSSGDRNFARENHMTDSAYQITDQGDVTRRHSDGPHGVSPTFDLSEGFTGAERPTAEYAVISKFRQKTDAVRDLQTASYAAPIYQQVRIPRTEDTNSDGYDRLRANSHGSVSCDAYGHLAIEDGALVNAYDHARNNRLHVRVICDNGYDAPSPGN